MPPNTKTAPDELQLVGGQKINNQVGLDRDSSIARPSWDDVVDAGIRGHVIGYELGRSHGLREAADELDAQVLRDRAAEVVLNAAKDLHVAELRRTA